MPKTWLNIPRDSDFSVHNLPFGVFSTKENPRHRIGIAIGEYILDLSITEGVGFFADLDFNKKTLQADVLNPFISEGKTAWQALRSRVQELFSEGFEGKKTIENQCLVLQSDAEMHLPVKIGDYTDFYSSEQHATNVGKMFRDPNNPLLPNWKHLPVAYHGRASSIKISGTNFHRPKGQFKVNENDPPIFAATNALDFELEMAAIIGKSNALGDAISVQEAADYVFGFVIFNDWSARDIQRWEAVPLGPFLGKNFFSAVSPWVVTMDALEPFKVAGEKQTPSVLAYLQTVDNQHFNVELEVSIQPQNGTETIISKSNFKNMYWNIAQQIAHHTVNGCNLNVGDILASGTISGETIDSFGSMLELTLNGQHPLSINDNLTRKFIEDGDTVIFSAHAESENLRVGFGEVRNTVLAAK